MFRTRHVGDGDGGGAEEDRKAVKKKRDQERMEREKKKNNKKQQDENAASSGSDEGRDQETSAQPARKKHLYLNPVFHSITHTNMYPAKKALFIVGCDQVQGT